MIYLEEARLSKEQIEYLIQKLREAIRCNSELELWTVLENDLEKARGGRIYCATSRGGKKIFLFESHRKII